MPQSRAFRVGRDEGRPLVEMLERSYPGTSSGGREDM